MLVFIMSEINILYAFDTAFCDQAAVSILSLLENKRDDTVYHIFCMVPPHTRGQKVILKIIQQYPGTKLTWRVIRHSENPFRKYDFSRWSPVIFYRLFAHRIFPNTDKILYLDSDTLVCDDLSELYSVDITNYVMGAVRDMAPTENQHNPNGIYVAEFTQKYLKNDIYFNSGVLLINVKKMTEYEHLIPGATDIELKYPDQDLLNVAFDGKILSLPLRYNFGPGVKISIKYPTQWQQDVLAGNYAILHFYTVKPYDYTNTPHDVYSRFYNTAKKLNLYPEDFMKRDMQRYHRKKQSNKTVIPFVRVIGNTITLFGIKIHHIRI